jgi:hypothetical protein
LFVDEPASGFGKVERIVERFVVGCCLVSIYQGSNLPREVVDLP